MINKCDLNTKQNFDSCYFSHCPRGASPHSPVSIMHWNINRVKQMNLIEGSMVC